MNFDERWYKNRVKVVGSKYQPLYDVALQEYVTDADGSLEGRNIDAQMIRLSSYIYFTLLDMTPSTFIGRNGTVIY
jgi:hypothetical protein